ncbi:MAG: type II secretion system major pseudopilin GspG [Opitutales bacterium]
MITLSRKILSPRASTRGFTLLEILVVIGLVGALMAVLVGGLVQQGGSADREIARIFVQQSAQTPLQAFRLNMNRYPTTEEGLQALVTAPSGAGSRWAGPYTEPENLVDPWGQPYQYRFPGQHNPGRPDIWSAGPDGQSGTADDVTNWEQAGS